MSIWKHFLKSLPLTLLVILIAGTMGVLAGVNLDSPAAPGRTSSYTLEDLYQRLVSGTDGTQSTFSEPGVAPGTGTMHDINALMAAAPMRDDANGATSADVLSGATFWGLTNGEWGSQTGSITTQGNLAGADGSLSIAIPAGYYPGNTATAADADLLAVNIRQGVTIFGVTGIYQTGWNLYDTVTTVYGSILNAVDMLSSTDGWAVGEGGRIYRYDGSAWNLYTTTGTGIYGLDMFNSTDGWGVGANGRIYHWNGSAWSWHTTTAEGTRLYAVDMLSSTDGWAVGENGHIYHYTGGVWSRYATTVEGEDLNAVKMVSSTDGWAVGRDGYIYRWNGTNWSLHTTTFERWTLYGVNIVSSTDVWVVGFGGLIYHWNGSAWSLHTDTTAYALYAVDMVSSTDGWAVGRDGCIYHYDGSVWSLHTTTDEGETLLAVNVISGEEAWAVGRDGHIYIGDD